MAKKKIPIYKSPVGIASYAYLTKPDTQFKKSGEYKTTLTFDEVGQEEFIEMLTTAAQEKFDETIKTLKEGKKVKQAKALKLHVPIDDVYDDEGNETGEKKMTFKMSRVVTPKEGDAFTQEPDLFDSKGGKLPKSIKIGSGSKIQVAFQIVPFYNPASDSAGVTCRLKAVLIKELVEYSGGASASGYGFDTDDDGYVYAGGDEDESETPPFDVDDADDSDDDDVGDF